MTASNTVVWMAILLGGLGTFAIRSSFLFLYERLDLPALVERALQFVPAAVLAALVVPAVLQVNGTPIVETGYGPIAAMRALMTSDRVLAGALAALVAWRTEDVFATIVIGMGALLILGFV